EILQAKERVVRPYKESWQGTTASRTFRKGQTLYQKLAEYAEQDGLQVIWWLNRDFIIKDAFRIEKNILKTAYQIGEAVAGHFPEGISSYFCYRQRTLVFINEAPDYLNDQCSLLKSQNAY
ncbi:MAG: TcpQ domain-containing protein, partial [Colwellia sp.]|nr:TcpQ domain-containing protein [Colwellia sp.]